MDAVAAEPLPDLVRPMLAVPGELPRAAEDGQWRYELKWDGVRAVSYLQGGNVRLMSRNDLDVSRSYPEVLAAPGALRDVAAVLDGELVTFDDAGRPSFGRLAIISSTFRRRTVRASTNASIAPSVAPTTTTIVPPTTPKIAPAPSVSSDAGTSAATQTAYMSA